MMSKTNVYYYDSARKKNPLLAELRELFRCRELLQLLIVNSIKTRYKRSALGVFWTMLNPLLYMSVLVVVFNHLFRFQVVNYPVYLLSGIIAWNFFSQTTSHAMNNLIWGSALLKRIYLPRSIFAVAATGNGIINLLLACVPLSIIMIFTHQPLYGTWWFVPIAVLILAAISLGVALIVSMIAVFFTDILDLYQILLQALFYLTPIMYPEEILPPWVHKYLVLNPVYDVVKVFRGPIYSGQLPSFHALCSALIAAFVILIFGWWFFTRKSDQIVYRI
jgi:ABC-type polysaccharide/polyol phosphate export permease